jgi:hypothetical protein
VLEIEVRELFQRIRRAYLLREGLELSAKEVAWLRDVGIAEQWAKHWVDDDSPQSETTFGVCV